MSERNICRDILFLKRRSENAGREDLYIAEDLKDTLAAHRGECVGMAANMIGYSKRMIIVSLGLFDLVMINPAITEKKYPFETEEGCLSLTGVRKTVRYKEITVRYEDQSFKTHNEKYTGWTAQIIQHECDHLEGIII